MSIFNLFINSHGLMPVTGTIRRPLRFISSMIDDKMGLQDKSKNEKDEKDKKSDKDGKHK